MGKLLRYINFNRPTSCRGEKLLLFYICARRRRRCQRVLGMGGLVWSGYDGGWFYDDVVVGKCQRKEANRT